MDILGTIYENIIPSTDHNVCSLLVISVNRVGHAK
jgi:hypothetical protein